MPLDNIALRFHPNADPDAVEATYAGVRYETRRHARWAVFLDAIGVDHVYRPKSFQLGRGLNFAPDFWLPALETWLIVRSDDPAVREADRWKIEMFVQKDPDCRVWLSSGAPRAHCWHIEQISGTCIRYGMLLVDERQPAQQLWICGIAGEDAARLATEAVDAGTGRTMERPHGFPADPNSSAVMRMAYSQVEHFREDSWIPVGRTSLGGGFLHATAGLAPL